MKRTELSSPPSVRRADYLVAALLFVLTFAALGLAQRRQGVVRDEGTYFHAAKRYWGWFEKLGGDLRGRDRGALRARTIMEHWQTNREHPVLLKSLFAFSWRLFGRGEDGTDRAAAAEPTERARAPSPALMSEISAFRLPGWLFTALGVALIYLFGLRLQSRTAGLTAALLYVTMPRLFFHGQLACFDSAAATTWLLVVYSYFRALSSARWGIVAGLAFGVALATKHNAWFIPPLLLLHYLLVVAPDVSLRPLVLPRIPLVFVAMALLGPLVFYAHWPWLWFDTERHLREYFAFHLHHSFYNMEFLGLNYGEPPLPVAYPFVMTLFTVPTVTLVLAGGALWAYGRAPLLTVLSRWVGVRPPRCDDPFRYPARRTWLRPGEGLNPRPGLLLLLNGLFPIALIALPWTPIFGGTKHWLPAYPFIALAAGVSLSRLLDRLVRSRRAIAWLQLALPLLVAAPGALSTAQTHPFGLSQYNALAGGVAGGADLGLNRQFWGYAPRQLLSWMNDTFVDNARVYIHDISHSAYRAYIHDHLLRPDIRDSGMELPGIRRSQYAMVIHELHFNKYDYWIWSTYGTPSPVRVLMLDGVPLVSVYARPEDLATGPTETMNDTLDAQTTTVRRIWQALRIPVLIYLVTLGAYAAASGSRMKQHSRDNHYVYLARALIEGRLSLRGSPPHGNDWALVQQLTLKDGRQLRGTYLKTGEEHLFKTTDGRRLVVKPSEIRHRQRTYYVSFPWFPALLMLPFVAIWGLGFNDVIFNVMLAPFNAVLVFLLLRRLARLRYSERSLVDDLWLTGLFAFGTAHFFASVVGQVWYTAHVVGVGLTALYALAAIEGRHPVLAGLCLGLGFVTRTPIPFSFPLLLGEVLRRHMAPAGPQTPLAQPRGDDGLWERAKAAWPRVRLRPALGGILGAATAVTIACAAFVLNYLRFDSPFEFGHYFLDVRWTERIQRWGLFNYHFIARNLATMLCLLPRIMPRPPYIQISHDGLSLFFTTPIFAYLIWPQRRSPIQPWLYLACLGPLVLHLMYQHNGWQQFAYRFSLDYTVYLVALLAIGGYRLGLKAKLLIGFSVLVNSFGAATFYRAFRYYWDGGMFFVK